MIIRNGMRNATHVIFAYKTAPGFYLRSHYQNNLQLAKICNNSELKRMVIIQKMVVHFNHFVFTPSWNVCYYNFNAYISGDFYLPC